jgi:hypothetical protein
MITKAPLQEFIGMRPFRRFALETTGGNYVIVESADHIKLPPPNLEADAVLNDSTVLAEFLNIFDRFDFPNQRSG